MYVYTIHTHRNVHISVYILYMPCMCRGLCTIESCVVVPALCVCRGEAQRPAEERVPVPSDGEQRLWEGEWEVKQEGRGRWCCGRVGGRGREGRGNWCCGRKGGRGEVIGSRCCGKGREGEGGRGFGGVVAKRQRKRELMSWEGEREGVCVFGGKERGEKS